MSHPSNYPVMEDKNLQPPTQSPSSYGGEYHRSVSHHVSSVHQGQSNGRAEVAVKTVKRFLRSNTGPFGSSTRRIFSSPCITSATPQTENAAYTDLYNSILKKVKILNLANNQAQSSPNLQLH